MSERRKSPVEPEETEPHMCTINVRLEILRKVPIFSGLADKEVVEINRRFVERGYEPEQVIYYEGEPAERLFVVASGKVKLLRHTATGKDVLLDILQPGEFFGSLEALGDVVYPDTAQAQTGICALSIGLEDFREILRRYPVVVLQVLERTAERLRLAHEMVRQLSVQPVERRIAYTLLKLADKLGAPRRGLGVLIEVPLSRDDLAEMTGTTTETASRVISQFQKDGILQSGRQWISIMDRDALEAVLQVIQE